MHLLGRNGIYPELSFNGLHVHYTRKLFSNYTVLKYAGNKPPGIRHSRSLIQTGRLSWPEPSFHSYLSLDYYPAYHDISMDSLIHGLIHKNVSHATEW